MAFGAKQISPIDFNKSAAVGVNLPFSAPGVFKSNYTTAAAIKNNLINFFLTNPGDRPLNPLFGGGLRDFLFEQIVDSNLDFLKEEIQNKLKENFFNINVVNLKVDKSEDSNQVRLNLTYSVVNKGITDNLEIEFI
jgi:phage baseplate assembly protein W